MQRPISPFRHSIPHALLFHTTFFIFTFPACSPCDLNIFLILSEFVFLSVCAPSSFSALCLFWYYLISYFYIFLLLSGDFQFVAGRLSLYGFSRLSLIIPLHSMPVKSFNYKTPPSVIVFTSYSPNKCILSFPRCLKDLLSYINTKSPSLKVFFLMCLS
jgi:hypothetical protein